MCSGLTLPVLVECDTGALRCGVTTPAEAAAPAEMIDRAPGLAFRGLTTYPPKKSVAKTNAWLAEAVDQGRSPICPRRHRFWRGCRPGTQSRRSHHSVRK
ncbi:MAG: alanine racemase [Hyphomicrobiales bacterium]|nr:alanine racemase [Hyphomicrobiales bacterium]